jgi:hypothetical protein
MEGTLRDSGSEEGSEPREARIPTQPSQYHAVWWSRRDLDGAGRQDHLYMVQPNPGLSMSTTGVGSGPVFRVFLSKESPYYSMDRFGQLDRLPCSPSLPSPFSALVVRADKNSSRKDTLPLPGNSTPR